MVMYECKRDVESVTGVISKIVDTTYLVFQP